ncbi:hypothetical protein AT268_33490 [Bacillus cereus]|uniref:Uncharacterized protein n=1 Tax=Bacillus cereus TaxID=1396 RepID=A0A9X0MKJ9_BACCE|nr:MULTISPECIES: hypothetical protein [Bacillus cereus group]KXY51390.1 hypothetical protein AT268_33490 [Bacillus cereus]PEZ74944.1 hypothetical protein CN410_12500 [Bacillus anthracis]PFA29728.1 hypothetical protein CN384_08615 [Bacillus thuringiensis]PGW13375.1 hypothetical protein COD97_08395 [Bacillus cereus]
MSDRKKGGFFKTLSKFALTAVTATTLLMSPIKAYAHDAYFMGIAIDFGSNRYNAVVSFDDNTTIESNHRESEIGIFAEKAKTSSFEIPSISGEKDKVKKAYDDIVPDVGKLDMAGKDWPLVYTFPGYHTGTTEDSTAATGLDRERAYWVADTLVNSFNDALSYIMSVSGFSKKEADKEFSREDFVQLAINVANASDSAMDGNSGSVEFNGKSFAFSSGKDVPNPVKGTDKAHYVKIKGEGAEPAYFVAMVPKGYYPGQELATSLPKSAQKKVKDFEVKNLDWKRIVLQGNTNYVKSEITFSQVDKLAKPGKIEQYFSEFISSVLGTIRQLLGLYSFQELMLNDGQRSATTYQGIMPLTWFDSAQSLFWVCQCLAWALIIGAIVKLLVSRNLSAVNPMMRVNLIDGIQNLLMTGFMLALIGPLFHILAIINYKLVAVFGSASNYSHAFGTADTMSSGLVGAILINIAFFIIMIYFNFVYIMRAITVALLYSTAPLFVVSIAFGGKYKQLFGNYMKELTSNIYMQTFHALMIAFFANVTTLGQTRLIESIILLIAFVPMTQWFRQNLMGLSGGGISGQIGGQALSMGMNMVGGATAGYMEQRNRKKTMESVSGGSQMNKKGAQNFNGIGAGGSGGANMGANSMADVDSKQTHAMNSQMRGMNGTAGGNSPTPSLKKKSILKEGAKGMGRIAMATAKVGAVGGVMAGSSAVGDRAGMGLATDLAKQKGMQTFNKANDSFTARKENGNGNIKSALGTMKDLTTGSSPDSLDSYTQQAEGYMKEDIANNGAVTRYHNVKGLEEDTGIKQMVDVGDNKMYVEYDFDETTQQFNNSNLNGTQEEQNLATVMESFKNNDKHAMDYYKTKGILHATVNKEKGTVGVWVDKEAFGYKNVSKSGNNYIIQKDMNANFSNNEMLKIPNYRKVKK